MRSLNATHLLLGLIAVLLAANLLFAGKTTTPPPALIPSAAAQSSVPLEFLPARPQWLVTAEPSGQAIYVWKYNGIEYESARYAYSRER